MLSDGLYRVAKWLAGVIQWFRWLYLVAERSCRCGYMAAQEHELRLDDGKSSMVVQLSLGCCWMYQMLFLSIRIWIEWSAREQQSKCKSLGASLHHGSLNKGQRLSSNTFWNDLFASFPAMLLTPRLHTCSRLLLFQDMLSQNASCPVSKQYYKNKSWRVGGKAPPPGNMQK